MLRNYFIATIRNALKNRLYTIINLLGLTVGGQAFFAARENPAHVLSYE